MITVYDMTAGTLRKEVEDCTDVSVTESASEHCENVPALQLREYHPEDALAGKPSRDWLMGVDIDQLIK